MSRKKKKHNTGKKVAKFATKNIREELFNSNKDDINLLGILKKNYQMVLLTLLLAILVLITYRKAFNNEFVDWDDYTYVVENDLVRNPGETTLKDVFSRPVSLNYHPLTILSLRLNNNNCNKCAEGISAAPFIKWNVIIHLLNTLLVFLLIYLLSKRNIFVAFIVAALFGVHPMHVESVAWISERKDLLYTFFFLSGLITYLQYLDITENNKKKYLLLTATFLLFILSCLSKAMAVAFPLVLILIRFWTCEPVGNNPLKDSIKETLSLKNLVPLIPFLVISMFFGFLAISINKFNTFSFGHRIQTASYGFIMYIVKFFIPANQAAIYPYPTQAEYDSGTFGTLLKLAPFLFVILSGLVLYSLKRTKLFVFGIGFYFVTVMMVLQFVSVGVAIMADRYTYLSYVGLAFIPAMLIGQHLSKKRIPLYILSGCFIILMMILSQRQTEVWSNSETLWTRVIELYPTQETPRSIRGLYYSKRSKMAANIKEKELLEEKAMKDFKVAISGGTKRADVFEGAGCIYGNRGELTSALLNLDEAIKLKPDKGSAYYNRGLVYSMLRRNEEAIRDYNVALVYQPENALAIINNRSNLFLITGKFKEAIIDFDFLISLKGNNFVYFYNRAFAKQQTNDLSGAREDYLQALRLKPDDEMSKLQLQKLGLVVN
jgi:tetratricopeptide (TPR) repeat protein